VLTGDEIKQARLRADLTQADLAKRVGVSTRSIGNYERGETVPRAKMPRLEAVLADYLGGGGADSLRTASDAALLAEIARRFDRARDRQPGVSDGRRPPTTGAEDTSASDGASVTALPEREQSLAPPPHQAAAARRVTQRSATQEERRRQDLDTEG
jgi:transcriptional regulator with XRE-family HTH domain